MNGAVERKARAEPPSDDMARLNREGFSLLPLGGGEDGKSPLVKFQGKSLMTLSQVLGPMHRKQSQCYGIRLQGLAVIDCDVDDPDLVDQLEARFGASPVHVKTPRGRHLYYGHDGSKLPNLRAEGLAVDIKTGVNSYVMGPGSVRPDGGEYVPVKGDLAVDALPMIKVASVARVAESQATRPGLIPEGKRNKALCDEARRMVEYVDDVDELAANLRAIRDDQCENPQTLPDCEIAKIAKWAWTLRLEDKLYRGRDSEFPIHRAALYALRDDPNEPYALVLYLRLLDLHGHNPAREFPLDYEAMKKAGHTKNLSRRQFKAARDTLLEIGVLEVAQNHVAGKRKRTYRLKQFRAELPENVTELR